jgi:hypothetical protein
MALLADLLKWFQYSTVELYLCMMLMVGVLEALLAFEHEAKVWAQVQAEFEIAVEAPVEAEVEAEIEAQARVV